MDYGPAGGREQGGAGLMSRFTKFRFLALILALALAAAACGGDDDSGGDAAPDASGDDSSGAAPAPDSDDDDMPDMSDDDMSSGSGGTEDSTGTDSDSSEMSGPEPESVELDFLVFETPNLPAEFWDDAIDRTVADFPQFSVNKLVAPDLNIAEYLTQLAATDQLPDVMMSNFPTADFIAEGLLLPFEESDLERFIDPIGLGYTNGAQYALPMLTVYESGIFYNQDMFDQAGIAEEPSTWEELIAAAEAIEASGNAPFVIGGGGDDRFAAGWPLMNLVTLNTTGIDPTFNAGLRSGENKFTDPEFIAALERYEDFVARGWISPDALSLGYVELQQTFLDGAAAMYPMGSFFAGAVPLDHPFEIGVFPMPTLDGANRLATYTSGGPAISAATENPEQARLFAVEFATNVETNLDDLVRDAHIPNNKNFMLPDDVELHPLITEVIEILADPTAQQVAFFSFEVGDAALVGGFQNELWVQSQELLAGKSAADVAQALQDAWDDLSS